ncbi:hypothetical protein HanXRQr2_Chr11g0490971 [Helianthus annuus]|uniref:Uncharacterized protein n=1 Tax=Helianthus annuus TaxID=4232 RepID=A0A9K3HPY0_HELAN|nr:hypothetical protein HanXRQr2_Chr11g0490971 [Helianthus annuus]KAJ0875183.1 hypothetical protein HanPSC8_Chr11g0473131 [Helianthus annuus]
MRSIRNMVWMVTKRTDSLLHVQVLRQGSKESQLTWTQEWKANGSRVNKEAMHNSDTRCI